MVEDSLGKKFSAFVRGELMQYFRHQVRDTQRGGVTARGSDFCHHLVRSFFTAYAAKRLPAAALFVDVIGAFDSLIRSTLFEDIRSDEQVAFVLRQLNFKPSVFRELVERARSFSILANANVPPHLELLVSQCHTHSWFSTQNLFNVVETSVGSRAGNPFADVMFNFLVTTVMCELEEAAHEDGLIEPLPPIPSHQAAQALLNCCPGAADIS